jgi:hypothetical protein
MARDLGSAWVRIGPDLQNFARDAAVKISAALKGVNPVIPVGADTAAAQARIAALKAELGKGGELPVSLDSAAASAALKTLKSKIQQTGLGDFLDINLPPGRIAAQIQLLRRMLAQGKLTDFLGVGLDTSKIGAQVAALSKLSAQITVGADTGAAGLDVASLKARIDALVGRAAEITIGANDKPTQAALLRIQARLGDLSKRVAKPGIDVQGTQRALADILSVSVQMDKLIAKTAKPDVSTGLLGKLGGLIPGLGGGAAGAAGGAGPLAGLLGAGGGGAAAGIGGGILAALASGAGGIIPALLGGGLGLGALGGLALPTVTGLSGGLSGMSAATTKYQTASANLGTAIHQSPADMKAYQDVLKGLEPDLAKAATLLTNQSVTWQTLTPKRRASEIALRNNAAAYKTLLPSQKDALNALIAEGNQWNQLSPAQQKAAAGIQAVQSQFSDMATQMEPAVLGIITALAKLAGDIMPFILPLAKVAAPAVLGLVNSFDKFARSPGFAAFMGGMTRLAGPTITAVGEGVGKIVVAVGKLILALISPDALRIIGGTFTVVAGIITGLAATIRVVSPVIIAAFHDIASAFDAERRVFATYGHDIAVVFDGLRHGSAAAVHQISDDIDALRVTAVRVGHAFEVAWDAVTHWLTGVFGPAIGGFFTKTIPGWWDTAAGFVMSKFVKPVESALSAAWNWVSRTFGTDVANFFTKTLPGWWDAAIGFVKTRFVTPFENDLKAGWDWVVNNVLTPIHNFFLITIPGWWDNAITFLRNRFVTPFENSIKGAWTWVTTNVFNPIHTFFTSTISGWFDTAVSKIGTAWSKIGSAISGPVNWVLQHVIDPLFSAFDDVTQAVGLKRPLPTNLKLAAGGRVPGWGGGDRVPALLEAGEAIVPKHLVPMFAAAFGQAGIPGFATGGVPSPGRGGALGVTPQTGNPLGPLGGFFSKLLNVGKIVADLSHGDAGGASRAFAALIGKGAGGAGGELATILTAIPGTLITDVVKWIIGTGKAAPKGGGGIPGGVGGPGGGAPAANAALARQLMPAWASGALWNAWNYVEMREAGWSQFARNPSSGAYGIPQALPPSKMGAAANPPSSNPTAQIRWMISYLQSVYGGPIAAAAHEAQFNWYGKGGMVRGYDGGNVMPPGFSMSYNGTGRNELLRPVGGGISGDGLTPGERVIVAALERNAAVTAQLIQVTGQQGSQFATALNTTATGAAARGSYSQHR